MNKAFKKYSKHKKQKFFSVMPKRKKLIIFINQLSCKSEITSIMSLHNHQINLIRSTVATNKQELINKKLAIANVTLNTAKSINKAFER